ncbi:MAG: penicillin-binding protein activator LpoB [Nitrospira sp.]|nr:penicillin-binding protein activator LpoB [Nitrospira sp.]MCP9442959.1 penicillin-binding protein activator LpoB [Nitrospira sp.]
MIRITFRSVPLFVCVLLAAGGCGHEVKVTRVDAGVVTDLSGRWNDTDSRMVAEAMVKEALEYPWLGNFSKAKQRQPVVVVGTVVNNSHEHINVQTFITDLERELTNSQKVTFVAGKQEREEVRAERKEQAVYAREDTQKAPGKESGADFMLKGTIATIVDEADGTKAVFYQVDLQMIDLESNAKVWYGQKKIKKVVERKRTVF